MRLYHGGLQIIEQPVILIPNRKLDYGSGFYTTTSEKQATDWAKRKIVEGEVAYVSCYELDEELLKTLDVLKFDNPPGEEWIDFVHSNRSKKKFTHTHDVVYGPVANDRVYAAFALYESGLLSKEELLVELKTYKLVDQMLFHTEKSLKALTFLKAKEVRL